MRRVTSLTLALALLIGLSACSLALPEQGVAQQDRFVGFHLVYAPLPEGSQLPAEQVEGREDEEGYYRFSGLEGQNCFVLRREDEGREVYIAPCFQVSTQGLNLHYSDEGEKITFTAEAFCGPAPGEEMRPEEEYVCTAYRVYQRGDGSVYLNRGGDAFSLLSGGAQTGQGQTPYLEDGKSKLFQVEAEVTFRAVPRVERCIVRQLDENDAAVRSDVLTQEQAERLGEEEICFPLEREAAYVMSVCESADGSVRREIHAVTRTEEEGRAVSFSPQFLDSRGMGYHAAVRLEEER